MDTSCDEIDYMEIIKNDQVNGESSIHHSAVFKENTYNGEKIPNDLEIARTLDKLLKKRIFKFKFEINTESKIRDYEIKNTALVNFLRESSFFFMIKVFS